MSTYARDLSPDLLGRRVMVRYRRPGGGLTDAVGDLLRWDGDSLLVRTRDGEVTVPAAGIVAGKPVPERHVRHAGEASAAALQRLSARSWRAVDERWLGGWLLRAGGGFTGRANSVLPVGDPAMPLDDALAFVCGWYGERGLPAVFQLPEPDTAALDAALQRRGWAPGHALHVLVADIAAALATLPPRDDLPPVQVAGTPSDRWLAAYHYRDAALPPVAVAVLTNHASPGFAAVEEAGEVLAVARGAVDEGWLSVTAVEVAAAARRRGLGRHVMRGLLTWAAEHGARHAHLQVDVHNAPALAMYAAMGFTRHHDYHYRTAP